MLQSFEGPVTVVHTTQKHPLGSMIEVDGKFYVYCKGVTSGAAGKWVTMPSNVCVLLAANAIGRVGIMMAALDAATKFGWVQVYGHNTIASSDTVAAGPAALYIDGTAGRVDDAVVSGDMVAGAHALAADASNVLSVFLNFPFVNDALG